MPVDLDEFFSYETVQLVKIRDMRLGIPHFFFSFVIIVYIFCMQLIWNGGYLAKETAITGSVRLMLQHPTGTFRKPTEQLKSYCLPDCGKDATSGIPNPNEDCTGDFEQHRVRCPAIYSNAACAPPVSTHAAVVHTLWGDAPVPRVLPPSVCLPIARLRPQTQSFRPLRAAGRLSSPQGSIRWQPVFSRQLHLHLPLSLRTWDQIFLRGEFFRQHPVGGTACASRPWLRLRLQLLIGVVAGTGGGAAAGGLQQEHKELSGDRPKMLRLGSGST